jgi:hypothetical protein
MNQNQGWSDLLLTEVDIWYMHKLVHILTKLQLQERNRIHQIDLELVIQSCVISSHKLWYK